MSRKAYTPRENPHRYSRREMILAGGLSLLPAVLPGILPVQAAQADVKKKCRKVLYFWNDGGGPSNLDSFDPKPGSRKVDMIFDTIPTSVDGLRVTELYPQMAEVMQEMALLRARRATTAGAHEHGIAYALQRDPKDGNNLLSRIADRTTGTPFCYAQTPNVIGNNSADALTYRRSFSVGPLCFESQWSHEQHTFLPLDVGGVAGPRLDDKWRLHKKLERLSPSSIRGRVVDQRDAHMETAYSFVSKSEELAFDLPGEDIERYSGYQKPTPTSIGILMMRELVRRDIAGAAIFRNGYCSEYGGWDHHSNVEHRMREMAPRMDWALAELIKDYKRGMLENTLVVVDSEFGRTTRINGDAGRDHFHWHSSLLLGEELRGGVIIGGTDDHGEGQRGVENGEIDDPTFGKLVWEGTSPERNFTLRQQFRELFKVTTPPARHRAGVKHAGASPRASVEG